MIKMPNGASVSDWLGTAHVNADCATNALERISPTAPSKTQLKRVAGWLRQSLEDVDAILAAMEEQGKD